MELEDVLPRDAIPSIDDPAFGTEYFGEADDEVIVLEADPPRAYPLRILSYHEIVNDAVDGRPVAVTWCPICWSAVVYDRTVDGQTLTFGVSGKLADDALVMYDRETESEWKQPTGDALTGPLEGTRLTVLSAPTVTWADFREEYPDGVVLQPVQGTAEGTGQSPRDIYRMKPYEEYADGDHFGLYGMRGEGEPREWDRTDIDAKTLVVGVELDGEAVGYPLPRIEEAGGVTTDTVGGRDIVMFATGSEPHVFANPGIDFEIRDGTVHGDGTTWDLVTGESADGRALDRIPSRRLFAFAWQDAYGEEAFYGP